MSSVVTRSSQDTHSLTLWSHHLSCCPQILWGSHLPFLLLLHPIQSSSGMASISTFEIFQSLVIAVTVFCTETQECFFSWILCNIVSPGPLCSTVGARSDSGSLSTGPYSQSPSLGTAEERKCSALISSLIITFCSTPSSPSLLPAAFKYFFSAKRSKLEKAAKHRHGNLGGRGMKGHQPATPSLYSVAYAELSYEAVVLKKFTPVGNESQKARYPLGQGTQQALSGGCFHRLLPQESGLSKTQRPTLLLIFRALSRLRMDLDGFTCSNLMQSYLEDIYLELSRKPTPF